VPAVGVLGEVSASAPQAEEVPTRRSRPGFGLYSEMLRRKNAGKCGLAEETRFCCDFVEERWTDCLLGVGESCEKVQRSPPSHCCPFKVVERVQIIYLILRGN